MVEDIYDYIDAHADEYIAQLQVLCRQPSISAQGIGMEETADMVADLLDKVGLQTEQIRTNGHPVVYGELAAGRERTLLLYNHYDVQPPDPLEQWDYPPFDATSKNGVIYARGVADNKGNLMARLCAIDAWQNAHGELPLNIKCVFEGEEEIGSPNLGQFAEQYHEKLMADGCIWEAGYKDVAGRPQISLGCKGITYVELRAHGANRDLHSSNAAIVPSPVWRLVWAIGTLKDETERVLLDGFYDDVIVPSARDREMARALNFDDTELLESFGVPTFLRGATGEAVISDLLFQPTCNICGIQAGYNGEGSKTVLPNYASCKLDFRLVPQQSNDKVLRSLRNHLDRHGFGDVEIIDLHGEDPARTDPDHPLVDAVVESASIVYGQRPSVLPSMAGTGPMYHLCQRWGIGAVGTGVGHALSRNHAPNENIFVDDYILGIKHMAAVFEAFART